MAAWAAASWLAIGLLSAGGAAAADATAPNTTPTTTTPTTTTPGTKPHQAAKAVPATKPPPAAAKPTAQPPATDPAAANPAADPAKPPRDRTPMPVRYATMKFKEVNVRVGPGPTYPINWIFKRKDMPVEVTAEFGNFRKIRDWEGSEGWVSVTQLNVRRGVIIQGEIRTLHSEASASAKPVAHVEPGVIGRLLECPVGEWCRVEVDDMRGWINRSEIWGVTPSETVP